MHKLLLVAALAVGCGGGGSANPDADTPDGSSTTDASSTIDASDASTLGGVAPVRLVVSGAKRLHGAGSLVVDVEIGHPFDQGVRTTGSIEVRGGAAAIGN